MPTYASRCLAVLACLLLCANVRAETYHVSTGAPAALDDNPGTADKPWKSIGKAAATLIAGDTVIIHEGVYRETVRPAHSGTGPDRMITYQGAPGERVVIKGSVPLATWRKTAEGFWAHDGWRAKSERYKGYRGSFRYRSELLLADDRPLFHLPDTETLARFERTEPALRAFFENPRMKEMFHLRNESDLKVLVRAILAPHYYAAGAFVVDYEGERILAKLPPGVDPNRHVMEAAVLERLFDGRDRAYIAVRNIRMLHGAPRHFQHGALSAGPGWVIEDCEASVNAGRGVTLGRAAVVRRVTANRNGCLGFGGTAQRIEDGVTNFNNFKGGGWLTGENGGWKMVYAVDALIRRHTAEGNIGPGIWLDIDNRSTKIEQCLCKDNAGPGIFIEISGKNGIEIANNLCVGNGWSETWGSAGILLGESSEVTVRNNLVVGNYEGIAIRMQGPRTFNTTVDKILGVGEKHPITYVTRDNCIRDNIVALNRHTQLAVHGDNPFFGPHPSAKVNQKNTPALDPEKLNLTIDHNLYYTAPEKLAVLYGPVWRPKHRRYTANCLALWQQSSIFDKTSAVADPGFVNPAAGDYRLRPGSEAIRMKVGLTKPPVGMREIVATSVND